jgi:hypothetical protein
VVLLGPQPLASSLGDDGLDAAVVSVGRVGDFFAARAGTDSLSSHMNEVLAKRRDSDIGMPHTALAPGEACMAQWR